MRAAILALAATGCVSEGTALDELRVPRIADVADVALRFPGDAPAPDLVVVGGDLDGDGADDLFAYATGGRALYRLLGTPSTLAFDAEIIVAPAGDLDGDGRADLAISTPSTCEVYVLHGGEATAALAITTDCGGIGAAHGVGDLDGDGRADLVVAPLPGGPRVFHGRASREPRGLADADATLLAAAGDEDVGFVVAPAGDTDGDGRADFLVTTTYASLLYRGERFAGEVAADRVAERFVDDTIGPHEPAGLGDLDGDGRADLALNGFESLYTLHYGRAGGYDVPDAALVGTHTGPGRQTIAAGDLDGDGARDLAICDPELSLRESIDTQGGIHVLHGAGTRLAGATALLEAGETWTGAATSIAAGDLDGDGTGDLAIAVPLDRTIYVRSGR